jgi:hypothetical protein
VIEEAEMARSGSQERTKGASQQAQGRLKEAIGALTGNRRQASQGRADQGRLRLRRVLPDEIRLITAVAAHELVAEERNVAEERSSGSGRRRSHP